MLERIPIVIYKFSDVPALAMASLWDLSWCLGKLAIKSFLGDTPPSELRFWLMIQTTVVFSLKELQTLTRRLGFFILLLDAALIEKLWLISWPDIYSSTKCVSRACCGCGCLLFVVCCLLFVVCVCRLSFVVCRLSFVACHLSFVICRLIQIWISSASVCEGSAGFFCNAFLLLLLWLALLWLAFSLFVRYW